MFGTSIKKKVDNLTKDLDLTSDQAEDLVNLLDLARKNLQSYDENQIIKAFLWCCNAHKNKVRRSGMPFYTHPVAVARIVINEMPLDDISVISALLHDILDYSDKYSLKDLRSEFGSTVAEVVDGITKIRHIEGHGLDRFDRLDNYQKLLLSVFKDVRIILIKLADRLHNMRTLEHLNKERRYNLAKETMDIYSQFANRFGLANIKWELEDLAFKELNKKAYDEIKKSIQLTRKERESYVNKFKEPIIKRLNEDKFIKKNNIKYEISGRPKHIYSTYQKMLKRGLPVDELNDLFAIRIIIDSDDPNLCFFFYGIICELYKPVPQTFKNYIYLPKKNGYQSIHTAVFGPDKRRVEVQIRTRAMHEFAENGVAAHFKYKSGHVTAEKVLEDENLKKWMDTVREIFENSSEESTQELMESVRQNIFQDEIYVFTPANELKILPKDSTPLDFAFEIHSELGYHCISAKVNGKIAPLNQKLNSGDQVEILTSEQQEPLADWLEFVVTSSARSLIHKYLKNRNKNYEEQGRELWAEKAKTNGLVLTENEFDKLSKSLNFWDRHDFFRSIGSGKFDLEKNFDFILYKVKDGFKTNNHNYKEIKEDNPENVPIENEWHSRIDPSRSTLSAKYAHCCYPMPGDKIMGIITSNDEIIIHRRECQEVQEYIKTNKINLVEPDWNSLPHDHFHTEIIIKGDNRPGLLNDITTEIISFPETGIRGISYDTDDSIFTGRITITVNGPEHLNRIINKIKRISGVKTIERKLN